MKKNLWKWIGGLLILYSLVAGLLIKVPDLPVIHESIRNLFYHVCIWFAMIVMMGVSFINSLSFLRTFDLRFDTLAAEAARTGLLFGFLGIFTGMIWAKFTWGEFWVKDPQLNGAALTILIYTAYLVLRSSMDEEQKRARISAVYAVFAFVLLIVFIGVLPRLSEGSIHPGKDGNPGLGLNGLDSTLRLVFYPAIAGWILTGVLIWKIRVRLNLLKARIEELEG